MRLPLFLILALGLAYAAGSTRAQDFRLEFYAEIRGLADRGAYDEAERLVEDEFRAATSATSEERIALLDTLAELQALSGKHSDLGDTLWNKAAILTRVNGPASPDLAAVFAASGRAYFQGGHPERAVDAFEAALGTDRIYLKCDGNALAELYRDLARAYDADGQADAATEAQRLAEDPDARCSVSDPTRSVVASQSEGDADGDFALVKVLYATDRKPTGSERPNEFFGTERADVSYGEVEVSIPRIHKPGNVEAPSLLTFTWDENPAIHIVLMGVNPMDADAFFTEVGRSLGEEGTDEVFLFIHGFNVTFDGAAKRAAQMVYDLNFEGTPMFYSWASRGSAGAYMVDAASVQVSARHLAGFLEDLVARSGGKRLHIVAHSMGNRALTEALEIYALRHPQAADVFDQIIFAAPDVDSELFVLQTEVFDRLARRMTLYTSDADLALSTSKKLHGNPRAGLVADAPLVGQSFDTIDMSVVGAGLLNHSYFAADASALSDILWLFWRNPPPQSRCGMVGAAGEQGEHWMYVAENCESTVILSAISLARLGGESALARLDARIEKLRAQTGADFATDLLQELSRVRLVLIDLLAR